MVENIKSNHLKNLLEKGKNMEEESSVRKDELSQIDRNRETVLSEKVRYDNASDLYE